MCRSLVFGEDVGFGGVFRCTEGLQRMFGRKRVFNTPLSEQGIVGFGIGAAASGYTAVAEIQFSDYIFPALDQIINEAAKYRYRSGGEYHVGGLTIRAPYGAVGHGGMYHSQAPEAFLTHVPGLKVVIPSGPQSAKGLLLAAIKDLNPVVFLEPKIMYRLREEPVPIADYEIPLGQAHICRPGKDMTIVSWGEMLHRCLQAALHLSNHYGFESEVIDLRTLQPWDKKTVLQSVRKTGRFVVVHEAPKTSGFGAELVATISERISPGYNLKAPPVRVTGYDTPFPMVHEDHYVPSVRRIVRQCLKILL